MIPPDDPDSLYPDDFKRCNIDKKERKKKERKKRKERKKIMEKFSLNNR